MALKKQRLTKAVIENARRFSKLERHTVACKFCSEEVYNLSPDVTSVVCSDCCIRRAAPPELPAKKVPPEQRRPRGWQFTKEYRAPNGALYKRGELVDETNLESNKTKVKSRKSTKLRAGSIKNTSTKKATHTKKLKRSKSTKRVARRKNRRTSI